MRNIELTKVTARRENPFTDTDDVGENVAANANEAGVPVTINVDAIRCFYPRKNDEPGTRLTFIDGGGFAVSEPYADVKRMVGEAV